MANGNGSAVNGPGFVFGFSNTAVAIIGTVALGAIGAHLIVELFKPKPVKRNIIPIHNTEKESLDMVDTLFGEVLNNTSHPSSVTQNADRVHTAIKQRLPRVKDALDKVHKGEFGSDKLVECIKNNAHDIMEELGIPFNPHPISTSPDEIDKIRQARLNDLSSVNVPPGGLLLSPFERRFLDHEAMSYAAITDPVAKIHRKYQLREQRIAERLEDLKEQEARRIARIRLL